MEYLDAVAPGIYGVLHSLSLRGVARTALASPPVNRAVFITKRRSGVSYDVHHPVLA